MKIMWFHFVVCFVSWCTKLFFRDIESNVVPNDRMVVNNEFGKVWKWRRPSKTLTHMNICLDPVMKIALPF